MKKCTLALTTCLLLLLAACRKNDHFPKTVCQIKSITYDNGFFLRTLSYTYNDERLLTTVQLGQIGFFIQYNNKSLPISVDQWLSPTSHTDLIYQHGQVVRLDDYYNGNLVQQPTLKYDNRGRLIESRGVSTAQYILRWTYEGNSHNPKQKIWLFPLNNTKVAAGQQENLFADVIETYTYDNKINPETTFRNITLTPMGFGNAGIMRMEPIPDNNVIRNFIIGRTLQDTVFHKGQDIYTTYEYHKGFPVKGHSKRYMFPDRQNPVLSDTTLITYTYECIDK